MKIICPACKQKTEWQGNPYRPFCSKRCKLIDLGAWASGEYIIQGVLEDETASAFKEEDG